MRSWVELKRVLLLCLAVLALGGVAACDDEDTGGTGDTAADTAGDTSGGDTTTDTTTDTGEDMLPDTPMEDMEPEVEADMEPVVDACVAFAAGLGGGLLPTIGTAVTECGRGACITCGLGGGSGEACGEGGTMTSCILDCLQDTDAPSTAKAAVQAAIAADEVDLACLGCSAAITQCVVDNGCAIICATGDTCEGDADDDGCYECQCAADCPDDFGACSGLASIFDAPDCETDPGDVNACVFGTPNYCEEITALCADCGDGTCDAAAGETADDCGADCP